MEIVIGSIPHLTHKRQKPTPQVEKSITARLLHIRPTRKGIAGPSGMERRKKQTADPPAGRVLTILVADGGLLPADIETANYQVSLRLIRKAG